MADVVVQCRSGQVRGLVGGGADRPDGRGHAGDGIARFLGIPYAKPPLGPLRFQPPEPAPAWSGVRDAVAFGPTAPKPDAAHSTSQLDFLEDGWIPGDDFLNLNVWTPDPAAGGLPVMFWIHGGAYIMGSSSMPLYDGSSFARDGVVFVSANYRLGVEGFSELPDAPSNRGMLDLILALEWVRDNIAAFGGDPQNVTVFGESGGAGLTLALLGCDTGLFRRAAISSAALTASLEPDDAALVTADIARRAGAAPTAQALRDVDPQLLANFAKLAFIEMGERPDPRRWGLSTVTGGMAFTTVHGNDLLPERPFDLLLSGVSRDVDLLLGWTMEEMRALVASAGPGDDETAQRARGFLAMNGADPAAYDVYLRRCEVPSVVMAAAMTDAMFRVPALRLAAARAAAPTWLYEFAWPSPLPGVGAAHGLDLGFLFDNLGHSPIEGDSPPQAVASDVHRAWIEFAAKGTPGWQPYETATRPVMKFGEPSQVVCDPRSDERKLWPHVA